jgi:hypothetical protein
MESYELYLPLIPNRKSGKFQKGLIPHNKGVLIEKWMSPEKIEYVKKFLELGRTGNPNLLGLNSIPIVGVLNGKLTAYNSIASAVKILKAKGIGINERNVRDCIRAKIHYNKSGYQYVRKRAGGYQWFLADEIEKYKYLINN